jgi:NADPH:quinone reductase-like Zn-dependent oxidoreductase
MTVVLRADPAVVRGSITSPGELIGRRRMMRAVVQTGYGKPSEVLEVRELDRPPVGDDQVLVRVRAASVHPDVWHVVMGLPRVLRMMGSGLRRPKDVVPGTDMAGQVESVGSRVTRFGPGDEVFGETIRGMQWRNGGAYAEYVVVDGDALALKPSNVTFEQAATVPTSGLITLQNLPDLGRRPGGQRVLVNGAGGGVGEMAVQLARSSGAHVTVVIPKMFSLMARSTVEPRLPRPTFEAPNRRRSMTRLHDLLEDGSLTPIVARTFPLEQVPDAIALLASGRALGRVVIVP